MDVVLQAGPAPTLMSIAVTPANPTIPTGGTQQFTATGTYSDQSTQNITTQVTWSSSNTSVATISNSGLATAKPTAENTTISATQPGVPPATTTLTVQSTQPVITTTSLANGAVSSAYSATLTASGGTTPYNSWSIVAGALPAGLTLNSGAITGTPTTAATFNFTVQVSDSSIPVQSTTKSLSITVTAAPSTVTIFRSTDVPAVDADGDTSAVQLGVKFRSNVAGTIRGIRFYKASTNTGTHVGSLWQSTGTSTGTLLKSATFTNETASGWQQVNFTPPYPTIMANITYVASYHAPRGRYSINTNYFAAGVNNGPLSALGNGVSPNGVYRYGGSGVFPNQTWNASNYWVDVVFQP